MTSPHSGIHTLNAVITIRGFLCRDYPFVEIQNRTTQTRILAETSEVCDAKQCVYRFAMPVRELAYGQNRISARIPGADGEIDIEVIRTTLAGNF